MAYVGLSRSVRQSSGNSNLMPVGLDPAELKVLFLTYEEKSENQGQKALGRAI